MYYDILLISYILLLNLSNVRGADLNELKDYVEMNNNVEVKW